MTRKTAKKKRPNIPDPVKLELWAKAGGRCQFKGCNKPVWHDGLTMSVLNQSNIAHIVSWTPTGPRGDAIRSMLLATEISNLMLTCQEHNKLIDTKIYVDKFPESLLVEFKKEHEERIALVTDINSTHKTEVLLFKANIGDNIVDIDYRQTHQAALPYYPTKQTPTCIDLTKLDSNASGYWESGFQQIELKVEKLLDRDLAEINFKHLSVFGLGPIPFLMQLGYCLGNTIPMRLYQKHRDTDDWKWKAKRPANFKYNKTTTDSKKPAKHVALVLSLSGKINRSEYKAYLKDNWKVIEISTNDPNPKFLKRENQLIQFSAMYRDTLSDIRSLHGDKVKVHIFPAVPAPIAIELGRALLPKSDPGILVYDKQKKLSDDFVFIQQLG